MKKSLNLIATILGLCILLLTFQDCKNEPKTMTPEVANPANKTITIRQRADADNLIPFLTGSAWSLNLADIIFPTLLGYDEETMEVVPSLAKSLPTVGEITDGPFKGKKSYTFEILEEATWGDGKPVTAADYVFTIKAVMNPAVPSGPYKGVLEFMGDIQLDPDNPKKFTVLCQTNYIKAMENAGFYIIPAHIYDPTDLMGNIPVSDFLSKDEAKQKALAANPNVEAFAKAFTDEKKLKDKDYFSGAGAYFVEEWTAGQRIVLKKKENYWGDKANLNRKKLQAFPERIVYEIIADDVSALTQLKAEALDIMSAIPSNDYMDLKDNAAFNENFNINMAPSILYSYFGLNNKRPKLEDKRVRQALAYLIDVDEVIKVVKNGLANQVVGPIAKTASFYNASLQPIKYDAEKGRALLKAAGWEDSNGNGIVDKMINNELVEMNLQLLMSAKSKTSKSIGEIFKRNAKKGGVNIEFVTHETNVVRQKMANREFDIFAAAAGNEPGLYDPYQLWHTDSDHAKGYNRYRFGNAESDQLIEDIRNATDEKKRTELYKQFQQLLYDEQPALFLYKTITPIAIHKRFKNAKTYPLDPCFYPHFYH